MATDTPALTITNKNVPSVSTPTTAQTEAAPSASGPHDNTFFASTLVTCVAIAIVIALLIIFARLKSAGKWSLGDALSEEANVSLPTAAGAAPTMNAAGNVATSSELKASSSRLIALLGLVAILMLYVGAGLTILYGFALNGNVPAQTTEVTTYFLYGLVMFAPYIVNQFSSIFEWLK